MVRLAEAFPDREIVSALLRQLSWTHFLSLIYLDDPLKRDFYAETCRIERWNTRTLEADCHGIEAQIATLIAYRKSLIHECVTGQRRVTDEDLKQK